MTRGVTPCQRSMKKVNPNKIPGSWEVADRQLVKGHCEGFTDAVYIMMFALLDNYEFDDKDIYTLIYDIEHDLYHEVRQGKFSVPEYERHLEKVHHVKMHKFPDGIEIPQARPCTKGDEKHAYRTGYWEGIRVARALALKSMISHGVSSDDLRDVYRKINYKYDSFVRGYFKMADVKAVIEDEYNFIFSIHDEDPTGKHEREYYKEWEEERFHEHQT